MRSPTAKGILEVVVVFFCFVFVFSLFSLSILESRERTERNERASPSQLARPSGRCSWYLLISSLHFMEESGNTA